MSVSTTFTRLFPPPEYMTMSSLGIDISDASIKYVRFKDSGDDDLELVAWGDHQIPEGTVVGGEVKNGKALSEALRHLCDKCNTPYVRVSLPEERAYIFETVIPKDTPFAEIRGLLEFSLEENVPLSPKDAFFDYEIVEGNDTEEKIHVVVTVYAREIILSYYQACTEAGLSPISFEVEAAAVAHAVAPKSNDDTFMVVDFGRRRTGIGIVHKGVLTYTSTIEVGGTTLSSAMRSVLGETDEDTLTQIKNKDGIRSDASDPKVRAAVVAPIDTMVDALRARFEYWNTRSREHGQRPITKIVLCGGSSNLAGFPEYLTDALGVPAERADVWGNAFPSGETVPPIAKTFSYGYTTAIGLALSDYPDFKNRIS